MTTMMYQSDEMTMDNMKGQSVSMENVHRPTGWPYQHTDMWRDHGVHDHDKVGSETSSVERKKEKGCYNCCNIILCVFLLIALLVAACAGIGIAILLNDHDQDVVDNSHGHGEDNHMDGFLSSDEEKYLTKQFCNLLKVMMKSVDYPVDEGIEKCFAALRLIRRSEELHIEIHVLPTEGYTMKEKFRRALREQILADGTYRINGTDNFVSTNNGFSIEQGPRHTGKSTSVPPLSSLEGVNKKKDFQQIKESPNNITTITELTTPLLTASSRYTHSSFTSNIVATPVLLTRTESPRQHYSSTSPTESSNQTYNFKTSDLVLPTPTSTAATSAILMVPSISLMRHTPSSYVVETSTSSFDSAGVVISSVSTTPIPSGMHIVGVNSDVKSVNSTQSSTLENESVSIFTSSQSAPMETVTPSMNGSPTLFSSVQSTVSEPTYSESIVPTTSRVSSLQSSELQFLFTSLTNSELVSSSSFKTAAFTLQPSTISTTSILPEVSVILQSSPLSLSEISSTQVAPKASKFFVTNSVPDVSSVNEAAPRKITLFKTDGKEKSNADETKKDGRIVENLMLGGVLKLPFKTTSNFRFLFANNSDRRAVSPVLNTISGVEDHLIGPVTTTSSYKVQSDTQTSKRRFKTSGSGVSAGQVVVTDRAIPPPIFVNNKRNSQSLAQPVVSNNLNRLNGRRLRFTIHT